MTIFQSYEKTATLLTIIGAFRKAGITSTYGETPRRIEVNEDSIRKNKGFQEIWNLNIPVEVLSKRRQEHPFGVINNQFFTKD